jgi:crotonobetainyl-CoA:carnitine CoA-transferase CaiB-like acyl-CoA transferase
LEVVRVAADAVPRRPVRDLLESRGKRFTDLAADAQAARGQVSELLGAADALVVTPAAVTATGFTDPAELARDHPQLVIAVLTDFGLTGASSRPERPGRPGV